MRKTIPWFLFFVLIQFFSSVVYGAIPAQERAALMALYNAANGDGWTNNSGWKSPPLDTDGFAMPGTEGAWSGVTVSGDHVVNINLNTNQLSGSIPPELGNLSQLQVMHLQTNQLTGSIPPELGNLINLGDLVMHYNQLTGTIPSELGNLSNLQRLILNNNQLTGISTGLGNLSNLYYLQLSNNMLGGNIPPDFGNLSSLIHMYLQNNQLTGSIPPELGNLNQLLSMHLETNQLTGGIPPELGNLSNLTDLYLHYNKLSDAIPTNLMNLANLISLNIKYNCLNANDPGLIAWLNSYDPVWDNYQNVCTTTSTYTLYVRSLPETGVNITVNPVDNANNGNGSTNFTRDYNPGTEVTLTAPANFKGNSFLKWMVDNADNTNRTITLTMDGNHTVEAVYQASTYTLTVQSAPDTGAPITVNPGDNNNQGDGNTEFFRTYDFGTIVALTAPLSHNGRNFVKWLIDGSENSNQTVQITMDNNHMAQAVFQSDTYTLSVQSSPNPGVTITVSPVDTNGNGDGNTNFTRTYDSGTAVSLTAPPDFNGSNFIRWTVDGQVYTSRTIQVTIGGNHMAAIHYETITLPEIYVNRNRLNLGYIIGSTNLLLETITISNTGGGTLNWSVSTDLQQISLNPASGTNNGVVEVLINAVGLIPGKFEGVIYVSDPLASNSPVEIFVKLQVKDKSKASPPFGKFSTPVDGSTVSGSVPVTGWALGDTGIESVKIYREDGSNLVYIGDAFLVEGARPDVEDAYPDYPMNYKAGWGYMMLTNFLPNGGTGVFEIHATATDREGSTSTLGIKTITVDNTNAVKPFGAIDTPAQGGTASGSNYRNHGWVLTPLPNKIPEDGSTINVYVDGVNLGHPVYNIYRADVAELFPGYANSTGAHGYFDFDTTAYANGVHTIYWTATDSAGNSDGIGSRYFSILNSQGAGSMAQGAGHSAQRVECMEPVDVTKSHERDVEPQTIYPDDNGIIAIEIRELERVEIDFFGSAFNISPLPIGSTLDTGRGIFYWQPGPGFVGDYEFEFIKIEGSETKRIRIKIRILPK